MPVVSPPADCWSQATVSSPVGETAAAVAWLLRLVPGTSAGAENAPAGGRRAEWTPPVSRHSAWST